MRTIRAVTRQAIRYSPIPASMPTAAAAERAAELSSRAAGVFAEDHAGAKEPTPLTMPAMTFSDVAGKCSTPAVLNAAAPSATSP